MEDLVALHCLFLLGTDTWVKWQQRSRSNGGRRDSKVRPRGMFRRAPKAVWGGYGAEEMGIPYFKARGRYGLELVGEVA